MGVTDPRAPDPSLVPGLILTCSLLVTALAIVVGNVVVLWRPGFNIIGIELLGPADLILLSGLLARFCTQTSAGASTEPTATWLTWPS